MFFLIAYGQRDGLQKYAIWYILIVYKFSFVYLCF